MVMPGDNTEMTVKLIQPIAMEGLRFAIARAVVPSGRPGHEDHQVTRKPGWRKLRHPGFAAPHWCGIIIRWVGAQSAKLLRVPARDGERH